MKLKLYSEDKKSESAFCSHCSNATLKNSQSNVSNQRKTIPHKN